MLVSMRKCFMLHSSYMRCSAASTITEMGRPVKMLITENNTMERAFGRMHV